MDHAARETITNWQGPENATVEILASEHSEHPTFTKFAQNWSTLSKTIAWTPSDRSSALPGFALKENIIYSALPMERELAPFLNGIKTIAAPDLPAQISDQLKKIQVPCNLTLYIALQCPHCPVMVNTLIPLAAACENIRLHIIDGTLFPENAQADHVLSAPCLILDNGFRWTGEVAPSEILSMILNRDASQLSTATLKQILEAGDAQWITNEMITTGTIFDGFVGLILHDTWSVRLGAMVVVEALAEQDADLGLQLAPLLIQAFDKQDVPTQGDMLYALGEIGDLKTREWIAQRVSDLAHDDLKDAAQDAMAAIEQRYSAD